MAYIQNHSMAAMETVNIELTLCVANEVSFGVLSTTTTGIPGFAGAGAFFVGCMDTEGALDKVGVGLGSGKGRLDGSLDEVGVGLGSREGFLLGSVLGTLEAISATDGTLLG